MQATHLATAVAWSVGRQAIVGSHVHISVQWELSALKDTFNSVGNRNVNCDVKIIWWQWFHHFERASDWNITRELGQFSEKFHETISICDIISGLETHASMSDKTRKYYHESRQLTYFPSRSYRGLWTSVMLSWSLTERLACCATCLRRLDNVQCQLQHY